MMGALVAKVGRRYLLPSRGVGVGAACFALATAIGTGSMAAGAKLAAEAAASPSAVSAVATAVPAAPSTAPAAAQPAPPGAANAETRPPPSPEQLRALEEYQREHRAYSEAAEQYQKLLTSIVRHHFEERRRRVVESLDKDISVVKEELSFARKEAIRQLKAFIAKYSGPKAHPQSTPDAMFRLAALYEEEARTESEQELGLALKPALALYRQIVSLFPQYEEIAGVHYYLGHAYRDSVQFDEAQQVWRSLVCSNRYSVRGSTQEHDSPPLLEPLPQDHEDAFWGEWYNRNPIPFDQLQTEDSPPQISTFGIKEEELEFVNPYAGCKPLPQKVKPGEEPRYVAEVWWQLGNFHFDQLDTAGGPYSLNRAAAAFREALAFKKPPLYGVALYKLAWTHFKQQRYATAVQSFVDLLHHADEQEELTGDPGADFRAEAYTYIAGSLTYVDFAGPPEKDPYIPRNDVLDLEPDLLEAERQMAVAMDRVQRPNIIPQDQKWTVEIYKALATEFIEITQFRNAIAAMELTLSKFPLDREAPQMQAKVAELYDELGRLAPDDSPVRKEMAEAALAARMKLANYVGDSPWTRANRERPDALAEARELVRRGLQRAAADHTNQARVLVARARDITDLPLQRRLLREAITEYRQAARGWGAYIEQNPNAVDVYESRFWDADARFWAVVLQVQLGKVPDAAEVAQATAAAQRVRDSNEDDRYLQPAAYYAVVISDRVLEAQYGEYERSGGLRGFAQQQEVAFEGSGSDKRVKRQSIPGEVIEAARARDDYNRRIDYATDPERNGLLYAFQAAEFFFVYGDFEQARARFEPIMAQHCGLSEWGYKAWEKLISMSNFEGDAARSRALVEGQSCAFDEETRAAEDAIRTPVRQGVAYLDARALYDAAEGAPEGPERDGKWREAAAAYKQALDAAPDRDEAPEAAMNGAYAYKQVGEYDKAIAMYELFIDRYGNDERLRDFRDGNSAAKPPVAADPAKYQARSKFLKLAYDALANAYVLFFNYPKAARTFGTISATEHFTAEQRRDSAQQALALYTSLGDQAGMKKAHSALMLLEPSAETAAEADYVVASAALKQWDQFSPDSGGNARARKAAESSMRRFYTDNQANPAAAPLLVAAAYWMAKMRTAARSASADEWWGHAMNAFAAHKQRAPRNPDGTSSALATREATMAAEGAYTLLDKQLRAEFDYDSGHHRFGGTPQEVLVAYQTAAKEAKRWFDELQAIVDQYASPEWGTAAVARQGALYDSLRTGLYNTRPPELKMFDDATEAKLRRAEESDNQQLQEKADAIRVQVEERWRNARDRELGGADQVMVNRYGKAIAMARRYNVSTPAVVRAIQRLAFFTDVIGEAKLQSYAGQVPELNYTPGMFLRLRPGLVVAPEHEDLPPAAPTSPGAQP